MTNAQNYTLEEHQGVVVLRDDLIPGGTKTRMLPLVFRQCDEVVFASPCQGTAQVALAVTAKLLSKKATIFVAKRNQLHPRSLEAKMWGARIVQVPHGRLSVVECRAKEYVAKRPAVRMRPAIGLRFPGAVEELAAFAASLPIKPDEVWCAAGGGVLASALKMAWPGAEVNAVAVGRELLQSEAPGCIIRRYPKPFSYEALSVGVPFPCDPYYEAKAWEYCQVLKGGAGRTVLFWNVTGPPGALLKRNDRGKA